MIKNGALPLLREWVYSCFGLLSQELFSLMSIESNPPPPRIGGGGSKKPYKASLSNNSSQSEMVENDEGQRDEANQKR
jgi:hypothetical protein